MESPKENRINSSDNVLLGSFELLSLDDISPNTKNKGEEVVCSDNKNCYVCKDVCSKEHDKEYSFTVKLKADKPLCVKCEGCKSLQMKESVKKIADKLGFEVVGEDEETQEEQESDDLRGKGLHSNYNFYPDRSADIFGNENNQVKTSDDVISDCISESISICSSCCCYSKDSACSLCIEGSFTCEGSCPCCSFYRKKYTDDGIEVLYEVTDAPS